MVTTGETRLGVFITQVNLKNTHGYSILVRASYILSTRAFVSEKTRRRPTLFEQMGQGHCTPDPERIVVSIQIDWYAPLFTVPLGYLSEFMSL